MYRDGELLGMLLKLRPFGLAVGLFRTGHQALNPIEFHSGRYQIQIAPTRFARA
jgi:hypothetical protein